MGVDVGREQSGMFQVTADDYGKGLRDRVVEFDGQGRSLAGDSQSGRPGGLA